MAAGLSISAATWESAARVITQVKNDIQIMNNDIPESLALIQ
jgi:hypothetical protein